ncbi:MAG TPA: cohesin domain-containing protein [Candidatus Limnocylindrales bacterium]|nr:cohesin domain-containing protein [Candidatus Limnocylindrales bacterium]
MRNAMALRTRVASAAITLGLLAAAAGLPAPAPARAASGDRVGITPATAHLATTGSTVTADIVTSTATPVVGAQVSVEFDPAVLQLTAVSRPAASTYWGGAPIFLGGETGDIAAANAAGKLGPLAAAYITPPAAIPPGSTQVVISVTFKLLACPNGGAAGSLTMPTGAADTILTDAGGNAIVPEVTGATLSCGARAVVAAQPAWRAATAIPVSWSTTPGDGPVTGYDVQVRRAPYSGAFGAATPWLNATTALSGTFSGLPGSTYCFAARARDNAARTGMWSAERCTAVPLDDRSLARSGSWTTGTGSAYYRSTFIRSTSTSAKAVRKGVQAKRIAIVASTCPTCGTVKVYWGSTLLKTISLKGKTANRKVFTVVTFTTVKSGTITLKPGSSGKRTVIDGLVISRS